MPLTRACGLRPQAPVKDCNLPAFLFFVVFICIVGFALMNLFSGVVFFQFTRIKLSRQTNDALLTDSQKHWKLIVYSIVRTKFPPRQDPPVGSGLWMRWRQLNYHWMTTSFFDNFIMVPPRSTRCHRRVHVAEPVWRVLACALTHTAE